MNVKLLFGILLLNGYCHAQKGFDYIRKAERAIEHGRYEKAEKLLNKSDTSDYGFCGNTWFEASEMIALNRSEIHVNLGEYLLAAQELNSIYPYFDRKNIDSLRMVYFIRALGKETIKKEIDSCINTIPIGALDSLRRSFSEGIGLTVNKEVFRLSFRSIDSIRSAVFLLTEENADRPLLDRFKLSIKEQPFYLLLLD